MKKFFLLVLLLVVLVAFSLTLFACGEKDNANVDGLVVRLHLDGGEIDNDDEFFEVKDGVYSFNISGTITPGAINASLRMPRKANKLFVGWKTDDSIVLENMTEEDFANQKEIDLYAQWDCDCADENGDHNCDYCEKVFSECANENDDHNCDICGAVLSECYNNDNDHNCDVCGEVLSECYDDNNDHKCDICGKKTSDCVHISHDHVCDVCKRTLLLEDDDNNHKCDVCGEYLTYCLDEDDDTLCDTCGEKVTYKLRYVLKEDDTYEVAGHYGGVVDVIIPLSYKGKAITSIGPHAFGWSTTLSSIKIGNLVETIGECAMEGCLVLNSVTLGKNVKQIDEYAFYSDHTLVEVYNLSSLNVVKGNTDFAHVGAYALDVYSSLQDESKLLVEDNGLVYYVNGNDKVLVGSKGKSNSLTISDGTTEIYKYALTFSYDLQSIVVPESVKKINDYAFYNTNLESITINSLEASVGNCVLEGTVNLKTLEIANTFTSVGERFCSGVQLECVSIPAEMTSILWPSDIEDYRKTVKEVVINSGESIAPLSFYRFYDLTKVTLANSIKSIGERAFAECPKLSQLSLSNTLTSIEYGAFMGDDALEEVILPSTLTNIGSAAFYQCYNITSITIPASVNSIGESAFDNCYKLVEVYNLSALNIEKDTSGNGCAGKHALDIFTSLESKSNLSKNEDGCIIYDNGNEKIVINYEGTKTSLTLPANTTKINRYAFYGKQDLVSVVVPNSVTNVGLDAFDGCDNLVYNVKDNVNYLGNDSNPYLVAIGMVDNTANSLIIADGCKIISGGAFRRSWELTSVNIADSVTILAEYSFDSCAQLTSITIPASITSIEKYAFNSCYKLVEIYNLSDLDISPVNSGNCGYLGYYALDIYTSLDTPSKLSKDENGYTIHTDGDEITLVSYYGNETELILPSGITRINENVFFDSNITSIVIPESVTRIDGWALGVGGLTSITFEDTANWYRAESEIACDNKTGGVKMDVTNGSNNVSYFQHPYHYYYWYKD